MHHKTHGHVRICTPTALCSNVVLVNQTKTKIVVVRATDKSICQVASEMSETESVCGKSIAGKFPTNLKASPSKYNEVSRKEAEAKEKEEAESSKLAAPLKYMHQATLKETLTKRNAYSKDSARYHP